ncbi:MAG TPA: hypothetical protein PLV83_03795 [Bacilli bacterium]|nr:hypothetical protein [Bacilli bacterium]
MEGINIIYPIIVFFYLVIIFLLNYYLNLNMKKNNKHLVKMEKINPTINLYCCDLLNANKLFWVSLLELIDNNYYKLKEIDDKLYIANNKKVNLCNYQLELANYVDKIIKANDNLLELEKLDNYTRKDVKFNSKLNNYILNLKKDTNEIVGSLDRFNNYKFSIIFSLVYSILVINFLTSDINVIGKTLIILPFLYFTIAISYILKNRIGVLNKKKYLVAFILFFGIGMLCQNIWNSNVGNNYIFFHFVMGILTYMYPLLIIINVYSIKTNSAYKNEIQKDLIRQINELKEKNDDRTNYIYVKLLKIKSDKKDTLKDKYFEILDI